MFEKVNPKQSFPALEEKILEFWDKNRVFEKSVEKNKGHKKYVFFDGPPFANGLPHYGHILANALKDAVTRYWNMKGYYVSRTNGWDCHGLPVEYEIEKELNLSGRGDIVEYGVEKFNNDCRASVFKYTGEWEKLLKRIGRWVDFSDSYATLDTTYMESIWWVFKQIWDKDMVYSGHKSMHVCPRCETPLSNFEVSQGYKDVTDLSVTVKFKLKDDDAYVLAWTTTPWTLPGNAALAFGRDIKYVKIGAKNEQTSEVDTYILAQDLIERYFKEGEYAVIEKVDVNDLEGKEYEPLFDFYKGKLDKRAWKICLTDFVTTEDGTGVVHIAPAFGEDDYKLAQECDLPMIQHVHMDGTFTEDVANWAGKFVKGQDQNVADELESRGLLFRKENYKHSYPHCWRCDTPLLNYLTSSLFIKVTEIKNDLLKNNRLIHWQPEHIKDGRFGKWLEGSRDWAISRNRFWGCPIPVWECSCGEMTCVGSIEELKAQSIGGKLPERDGEVDLHKPYIDDIKIKCPACSKEISRIPEVLDCWFESGSMPYAQLHYPYENKEEFENNFPAQFIAEGLDQTRGWFYTLHVLSTILFDKPAFDNVIVNGILLAANGEKLSKRKKNYPDPNELFATKGVDSTRYFLYSSPAPLAADVRFSENHVEEIVKKFTLTLWNTYSFFVTYASIDKWEPTADFDDFKPVHKLDRWILSELNTLLQTVTDEMDEYNLTRATRPMMDFLDSLSNWYVRRSRRRFWKSENDGDKNDAYRTLYIVLVRFTQILAPFMPFIADEIYRNLTREESVHLSDWPKVRKNMIKPLFNCEIKIVRQIVNLGHCARSKAKVKVRQPLACVRIGLPQDVSREIVESQKDVILEELNVKALEFIDEVSDIVERRCSPNARELGPKYGKKVQNIIKMARDGEFEELTDGKVKIGEYILTDNEVEVGFVGKDGFDVESSGGIVVLLDTVITDELRDEGFAREIVRYIQDMRKEADYDVSDRITVMVVSPELEGAIVAFSDYIKRETLANELVMSGDFDGDLEKEVDIDGAMIKIGVRR